MKKYAVLFNPLAGNSHGEEAAKKLTTLLQGAEICFHDMTKIESYGDFFAKIGEDVRVIIAGGDGTLNRFINDSTSEVRKQSIYYFATGSGNDFLHDVEKEKGCEPFCIDRYLENLPEVTVKGKKYKFINGIGYGIDGYCCEEGDKQRGKSSKPVNYTSIAIKGLLFHYKPTNAEVIVDGEHFSYRKVWLAPTMFGRFYGGGMMPAPGQDRLGTDGMASVVVLFGSGKLKTLMVFPSIFKGEHVKHTEMVKVHTGHNITVKFDRPTALQIDGETILGVTEYSVACRVMAKV